MMRIIEKMMKTMRFMLTILAPTGVPACYESVIPAKNETIEMMALESVTCL